MNETEGAYTVPRPQTYEDVFDFVRERASGYIADASSIQPGDLLIGRHRFGRDDVSYFAAELIRDLDLKTPQSDWEDVYTSDDMVRLLVDYLNR